MVIGTGVFTPFARPATMSDMWYEAKNPKSVWDKFRECQRVLQDMTAHEQAHDTERLMSSLSAFLSAFRTTAYRLRGVVGSQQGEPVGENLWTQLRSHSEIGFLIDRANCEIHGDGAVVLPRYRMNIPDPIPGRWHSRYVGRYVSRWPSRWRSNYVVTEVKDWRFQERAENLIGLCAYALREMENFIQQTLPNRAALSYLGHP